MQSSAQLPETGRQLLNTQRHEADRAANNDTAMQPAWEQAKNIFSTSGQIRSERRNRLKPKHNVSSVSVTIYARY
jgi:hypothetical protein